MKIQSLLILVLLASCQKEKTKIAATFPIQSNKTETAVISSKESFLKTDTILISNDKDSPVNLILANLVSQKADKDSIITLKFQIDFYQNKIKTASSKVAIQNNEKGSEWSADFGLTTASPKNSSFIKISYGYPACGYTYYNYLYYLKNKNLQLVYEWYTMSDSGWGNWVEFSNPDTDSDPKSFYCKSVAFEPADENDDNMGLLTYSDSTSFELKGNRWTKQLRSPKEKVYFEKKMNINDFYKQD
ncbi:hypothetical protein EV144_102761 [Flavobacterium sp. 270]|uniref:hypothetical protein n=1 Tax=Flavobacterium sp. 270 TaxID=2512114 RepID=UPI001066DB11|nr:hypothetical protein [Flavobacterium sp. 270]TDW50322.1 hypothetical protein EV144_102761 [Flavobacterium sp. 270]